MTRIRRLPANAAGDRTMLRPASALDAGHQSIPPLSPRRSWDEVTELAADEHAQHVAREGLSRR